MRKITNEELGRPTPEEFAAREKMPVAVVLDNVRSAQNVGAFFRTGDAFAVECIHLCGITAVPGILLHGAFSDGRLFGGRRADEAGAAPPPRGQVRGRCKNPGCGCPNTPLFWYLCSRKKYQL